MPIKKLSILLFLISMSFATKAQYNEAMCILLKQQMHEFRFNTSNKNYRSAARSFEKNCQNPTPVHNEAALENIAEQTIDSPPVSVNKVNHSNGHSGAILGTPEETTAPEANAINESEQADTTAEQAILTNRVNDEPAAPETPQVESIPSNDLATTTEQPKQSAAETVVEPVIEAIKEPTEISPEFEPQTPVQEPVATETDNAQINNTPLPEPTPAPVQNNEVSSSSSLLVPSLIVLLILLIAGLVIVRIRQSKQNDSDSELAQDLLHAQAIKAAAEAKTQKNQNDSDFLAPEPTPELNSSSAYDSNTSAPYDSFSASENQQPEKQEDDFTSFNATTEEQAPTDDTWADLNYAQNKQSTALIDDEPEQAEESEPEESEPEEPRFSSSSFGFDEYKAPTTDDEPALEQPEENEPKEPRFSSSSFGFDEYKAPVTDDEPALEQPEESEPEEPRFSSSSFGFDEYKAPVTDDEPALEQPEQSEPEGPRFSSSSFGFDEYKAPVTDDEPAQEQPEESEPEEPRFSSSSFGFDEYKAPVTDDEPALEQPEASEPEEPSFSSSSFGFDEYKTPNTEEKPKHDDVPEYDLSSLANEDLSFTEDFSKTDQTPTHEISADDDISDDDLAKALQALELELQDEPVSFDDTEQDDTPTISLDESHQGKDAYSADEEMTDQQKEDVLPDDEQTDEKPNNPFANLSLDPAWDPESNEKPVIENKAKQPKSQALIDAEERAKKFKTDD
ncbi:hypothetical protein L1267_20825 [Pseudoalteromonas sp. OFAV1]|uniref:hypothetical protein n=1 Tax=Pseudoalteromonas sp. OFAV1 TaxID=2908892 RepID=UPI001F3D499F|nr:hypothetical protein [Pseudoalteromonas sp. OFAV1]MCF2902817.1 hypothetical protein [Pseudoalteromonas sp. OFAV1]